MLHEQQSLRPTDAELRAKKARMHAKNQELDRELESVKADFHNSGLMNPSQCEKILGEIIEEHRETEKKLEEIIQDSNQSKK